MYDKKCLTFKAFFKQSVVESPLEHYRVRIVNIIYFLEDDTIVVMEPRIIVEFFPLIHVDYFKVIPFVEQWLGAG